MSVRLIGDLVSNIRTTVQELKARRERRWHRRLLASLRPDVGPDLPRVNRPWDWNELRRKWEIDRAQ